MMGLKRTLSSFIKEKHLSQKLPFLHKVGWISVQAPALPLNLSLNIPMLEMGIILAPFS